jgi:hypothetical protein
VREREIVGVAVVHREMVPVGDSDTVGVTDREKEVVTVPVADVDVDTEFE